MIEHLSVEELESRLDFVDLVVSRAGSMAPSRETRLAIAAAMADKVRLLYELGRKDRAEGAYSELLTRFDETAVDDIAAAIAGLMLYRAGRFDQAGDPKAEVREYREIRRRFGNINGLAVREMVAMSLNNTGIALIDQGDPDGALAAFGDVVARRETRTIPTYWRRSPERST